ncbi:MAG: mechanosensitive ion channel family protein [Hymenobacteraceae bacterium]|nr:mechanosensitive ion channel family protein [Hymenobacteraceae bacterium]MDX5394815.1 mechanosensitive ion channel family protein [Hymenobacteraceae bacterium]MDX5443067.1 mechanosensitive ion channel family protein [Hymenobacteraceae bacterium]MDX5510849.1 mechanosensitive ion channel family protein [Hymenobacteraceae bacterium]
MNKFLIPSQSEHWTYDLLVEWGIPQQPALYLNMLLLLLLTLSVAFIADRITRKILLGAVSRFAERSKTKFDDFLVQHRTLRNLAHLVPLVLAVQAIPVIFADFDSLIDPLLKLADIFLIVLSIKIARAFLRTCRDYLKTTETFRDKPVESFVQVFVIFLYFVGGVLIFSTVTGKDVWAFITALGAASAILLLVFKDTILGFVASIQVSSNDMVRIGDWITMEKYGADGDVVEINLTTVKVQNFDKTITTIPTYNLISDSFKNWRGMQNTGGRRIKRSVFIKISSIRYLSDADVERLQQVQLLKEYLQERSQEIKKYNQQKGIDKSLLINGRSLTNIGVFRKYIDAYLAQHEHIHKEMTMMVRQLAPTTTGIPIELYVFTNDVRWANYEAIMADIFDHLLAAVRYFDLEVFEQPAADDLRSLRKPEVLLKQQELIDVSEN